LIRRRLTGAAQSIEEKNMAHQDSARGDGRRQRGFAAMEEERQRTIAAKGGQSVPDEKRSFSQDRELAAQAGRKGGQSVPDAKRSFSQNRELAAQAGRKGGMASAGARRRETDDTERGV
jgi:uncharacterized protein